MPKGYITLCYHCKTECAGKYCNQCRFKEGRKSQDEANNKNFLEQLGKEFVCTMCPIIDKSYERAD